MEVILKEIAEPRKDISTTAPKILVIKIRPDQIGGVIGSGGKIIKDIKEKSGAEVDIDDDGTVYCTGKNGSAEKAKAIVEALTHEYKPGERYEGVVTKVAEFGAFVRLQGDTEGLVHVSEIATFRVDNPASIVKVGEKVPVIVKEVDKERGRISLSIKLADPQWANNKLPPKPATPPPATALQK